MALKSLKELSDDARKKREQPIVSSHPLPTRQIVQPSPQPISVAPITQTLKQSDPKAVEFFKNVEKQESATKYKFTYKETNNAYTVDVSAKPVYWVSDMYGKELQAKRDELQKQLSKVSKTPMGLLNPASAEKVSRITKQRTELDAQLKETEDKIRQQSKDSYNYKQSLKVAEYENVVNNSDFQNYAAKGLSLKDTEQVDNPQIDKLNNKVEFVFNNWIDKNGMPYVDYKSGKSTNIVMKSLEKYYYMTDSERAVYAYHLAKSGKNKAEEYLETLDNALVSRLNDKEYKKTYEISKEHPLYGTAISTISALGTPVAMAGSTIQAAKNSFTGKSEPANPDSALYDFSRVNSASTSGVSKAAYDAAGGDKAGKIIGGYKWSDLASDSAQLGLSILNSAVAAGLTGNPTATISLMASEAGGQTAYSGAKAGYTTEEVFWLSTVAAITEAVTEKIPIDNLFKAAKGGVKNLKGLIKTTISQMPVEATEEMISEVVNNVFEISVLDDRSGFNKYVESLMATNKYTQSQAEAEAFYQYFIVNTLKAGAGGAISGLVMAGAASSLGLITSGKNTTEIGKNIKENKETETLITAVLENDIYKEVRSVATELKAELESGKEVNDKTLGSLLLDMVEIETANTATPDAAVAAQKATATEIVQNTNNVTSTTETAPQPIVGVNTQTTKEVQNAESINGSSKRNVSQYSNGQAGVLGESTSGVESRNTQSELATQRRDIQKNIRKQSINSFTLGIPNGTTNKTVNLVSAENYDSELSLIASAQRQNGVNVSFYTGRLEVRGRDGKIKTARGSIFKDTMYIQVDDDTYTATQLSAHESFHDAVRKTPALYNDITDKITQTYSADKFMAILDRYSEAYSGVYDTSDKVVEEILADAYSGINAFGVQNEGLDTLVQTQVKGNTQTQTDKTDVTGIRYSLENKEIEASVQDINKQNEELKKAVKKSKPAKPKLATLEAITKEFLKKNNSNYSDNLMKKDIAELYDIINSNNALQDTPLYFDTIKAKALEVANHVVDNTMELNNETYVEYKSLREHLRQAEILFPKRYQHDIPDYGAFRKANFGRMPYLSSIKGEPIDVFYMELEGMFPEFFDSDEQTHPTAQLLRIVEVLDNLQPVYDNPYSIYRNEAAEYIADNLINKIYDNKKPINTTKSDKAIIKERDLRIRKLIDAFGVIKKGENAVRVFDLPKRSEKDKYVSLYARTVGEAEVTPKEMLPLISDAVVEGIFSHYRATDIDAWAYAQNQVAQDKAKAESEWDAVSKSSLTAGKNELALGQYLYVLAVKEGDYKRALTLSAEVAAELTAAGQTVQAGSLLKHMGGSGKLYVANKLVDVIQKGLDKRYKNKAPRITIPEDLAKQLIESTDPAETDEILDKIYTAVAEQIPVGWVDKWNQWRFFAMLFNLRTHFRNIIGNAVYEPVVILKDIAGATMEMSVDKTSKSVGGKGIAREKSIIGALPFTGGKYRMFAVNDFSEVKKELSSSGKYNPSDIIRDRMVIYKTRWLEALRKWNYKMLELEDLVYLKHHYVRALTQYLIVNKVDIETLNTGSKEGIKLLSDARVHAIKEAQKATYRDESAFATALVKFSQNNVVANVLVEGVLPFKKTPVNLLKRGIEASPIGLLKTVSLQAYRLKKGKITANEFIDNLSAGLVGTGISALGYFLASLGLISGGSNDDKESDYNKLTGNQNYAIVIGDNSYTLDWMAPVSLPLFIGVEFYNSMNSDNFKAADAFDTLLAVTEPMFNLSLLNGLQNTIKAAQYSSQPLTAIPIEILTGYLGQAVPTLSGQIARSIDETRRTTYTDKNSDLPKIVQYTLQRNQIKIPGASFSAAPYVDAWGREGNNGDTFLTRLAKNMVSPGYFSTENTSSMEKELLRLYKATGKNEVLPSQPTNYFNVGKARKDLTAEEYTKYSKIRGKEAYALLTKVTNSKAYRNLGEDIKIKVIADAYTYASTLGKMAISDYVPAEKWVASAKNAQKELGISTNDYIILLNQYGTTMTSDKIYSAYNAGIDVREYLSYWEDVKAYGYGRDADGNVDPENKSISQDELKTVLKDSIFTRKEKSMLWDLQFPTSKKTNPYR